MKPELLSPVGDKVMLKAAIDAGCDAVYFGVKELNMRATAKNFELSELKKVVEECHKNKVKAFLTVNTIVYEDELEKVDKILDKAKKAKVDAIIAWDMAVVNKALKLGHEVHLSTQASVSNSESANFFYKTGIKRIVLARECSLEQIKEIKKHSKIEIETFVHGAMCVSISGRCFLSQEIFGKSANRGDCLQPCRRVYKIKDSEEEHELNLGESYVLSPKDLCAIPFIDKLIKAGPACLKIEGRNKNPEYVKVVTECYRKAIDAVLAKKFNKTLADKLVEKLKTVYNRGFSSGFFLGLPTSEDFCGRYGGEGAMKKEFVGLVKNYYKKIGVAELKLQSAGLKTGDKIMFQGPTTGVFEQDIESMQFNHKPVKEAAKGKNIAVKTTNEVRPNDKVFLIKIR